MRPPPSSKLAFAFLAFAGVSAGCISSVPGPEAPGGQTASQSGPNQAASAGDDEDAPLTFCAQGPSQSVLLEDMEDNDNRSLTQDGRGGYWFSFKDDRGTSVNPDSDSQTTWCKPPPSKLFPMASGGANGSKYSARINGKLAKTDNGQWAGMGFALSDGKASCKFDASKYKGISFWAKKAPGSIGTVRLKVPDAQTDPDGKICKQCFNDHGMTFEFTDVWTQYTVPFKAMKQEDWGPKDAGIDATKIYGVQFQVNVKNAEFDIWVDDIQFTGCN
jgi:endoglucanase